MTSPTVSGGFFLLVQANIESAPIAHSCAKMHSTQKKRLRGGRDRQPGTR